VMVGPARWSGSCGRSRCGRARRAVLFSGRAVGGGLRPGHGGWCGGEDVVGAVAGVSNPEISDLTHSQPQPHCHDREDFVPGGDISSLWSAILS
jgi:hypothetical protein